VPRLFIVLCPGICLIAEEKSRENLSQGNIMECAVLHPRRPCSELYGVRDDGRVFRAVKETCRVTCMQMIMSCSVDALLHTGDPTSFFKLKLKLSSN
jgi:hypothetical protein